MKDEDEILLVATEGEAKYDGKFKALLNNPRITAPIIKMAIPEYHDIDIEEIITVLTSLSDVVDDISAKAAQKLDTEQNAIAEKLVRYDSHFRLPNPKAEGEDVNVFIYVDVEGQSGTYESTLGYPLLKRAMYYVARELVGQLGILTEETDYGKLCKCYSIWICSDVAKEERDTMTAFRIMKDDIFGESTDKEENYDLMQVVMIRRGDISNTESIFDYLNGLFTSDIERMDPYSGIAKDADVATEVRKMTGMGHAIAVQARQEGIQQGIQQGIDDGQNVLVKAIQMLKEGKTDEEILSSGVDQHTLDLAKVCR